MEIQTKSASLDTLSVTIQALHVNGKQMTLAVFRQLPLAIAYNDDGSLAPMEYWGIVRYEIKNQGEAWVVSASGGRLYRCKARWDATSLREIQGELKYHIKLLDYISWVDSHVKEHGKEPDNHWQRNPSRHSWKDYKIDTVKAWIEEDKIALSIFNRAEKTTESLMQLPQLFIAV